MNDMTMYMLTQLGSAYLGGMFQQPSFQPRNSFMGGGPDVDPMTKLSEASSNIRNLFNTGADTLNKGISLPDANIPQTPSWSGGGMPMAFGTLGAIPSGSSVLGGEGGPGGGQGSGSGGSLPHSSQASALKALDTLLGYSAAGSNGSGGGYGSGSSGGAGYGYGQGFNNAGIDLNAATYGPAHHVTIPGPFGTKAGMDVRSGQFSNPEARAAGFFSGNPFGGFYGGDVGGGGGEQFTDASMTGRKAKAY